MEESQKRSDATEIHFPDGFGWGMGTASYQIEGAVDVDGRSPSIWDTFSHTPGMIIDGATGDRACDNYHRWAEDLSHLSDLNAGYYRFSLAWPRLQPDGSGALNRAGVDFYARLVDGLRERGIEPWVTLYHWDLPQVLEDAGGWPVRDTALRFADYSQKVHEALGDRIRWWTTLNEPKCASLYGYASGEHAPGRKDQAAALRAVHHLLVGHGLALQAMREQAAPEHQFGMTLDVQPFFPASGSPEDADAVRRADGIFNRMFFDPVLRGEYPDDIITDLAPRFGDFDHIKDGDLAIISQPLDALGINYYYRQMVAAGPRDRWSPDAAMVGAGDVCILPTGLPTTGRGWEIDPDGLYDTLKWVSTQYDSPPLWVTESGASYPDVMTPDGRVHDPERIAYLDAHFRAAHCALTDGVDLRGYFVWTTMDDFEWDFGESSRFGLIHVDFDTQVRTFKDSAYWFANVAARNGLT